MSRPTSNIRPRTARSLAEVVTVLVLLGIVAAIAFPWMQRSREQSRRVQCQLNLKRIGEALQSYHVGNRYFPAGVVTDDVPVCNDRKGFDHNWITGLLKELAITDANSLLDRSASVYADINQPILTMSVPVLRCPSLRTDQGNLTCYAGNTGSENASINGDMNGVFYVNRFLDEDEIVDGLDYTVFVGEKQPLMNDAGWASGTRASLRSGADRINASVASVETDPCWVGGFGSAHVGGAYLMMGSGRWTFVSEDLDPTMLHQMTARADSANEFPSQDAAASE